MIRFALALSLVTACTLPPEDAPSPAPSPPRGIDHGKADAAGSCVDRCGEGAAGCWCDAECVTWGDCCADYRPVCERHGEVRIADSIPRDARRVPIFVDVVDADLLDVPLFVTVEAPLHLSEVGHDRVTPAAAAGDQWHGTRPLAWVDVECGDEPCDPATVEVRTHAGDFVAAKTVSFGPAEGALSEAPCHGASHLLHRDEGTTVESLVEGVWPVLVDEASGFHLRVHRGGRTTDRLDLVLAEPPPLGEPIVLGEGERLSGASGCAVERILVHELDVETGLVSLSWWGRCGVPSLQAVVAPAAAEARGCVRVDPAAPPWFVHFEE